MVHSRKLIQLGKQVLFLIFINIIKCDYEITGQFKECHVDQVHNQISFDKNCFTNEPKKKSIDEGEHNYTILSKRDFILEEIGYECKIKKTYYVYIKDFFLQKYFIGPTVEIVQLTKMDCLTLVTDQSCNRKPMNCLSNKFCHFKEPSMTDFPTWFGKNYETIFECQFRERLIVATNHSSTVVHDAIKPCTATDGFCLLTDAILI